LVNDEQLAGYRRPGFWSCMDTLKDKNMPEDMWLSGNVPRKAWDKK
jgi:glucose-1-phosphate cytidylyltransferase